MFGWCLTVENETMCLTVEKKNNAWLSAIKEV